MLAKTNTPLAQRIRAFGYGPKGRGFESPGVCHRKTGVNPVFFTILGDSNAVVKKSLGE